MEYLNYRELADLPDGRKFRQLEIIKNQATNLSVKATGLNLKPAKSVFLILELSIIYFKLLNGHYGSVSVFRSMQSKLWMAYCKTDVVLIPFISLKKHYSLIDLVHTIM